ncbi:hypothetical protein [Actinacidiphila acididurans]|uniref:Uncharacterized protein n=1 Tax=Actinacidiphila acididurans TaxID=2784346 RepID=A0ABS2TLL2_9ACTN|nr:hypothetical protein [Actinacidiphila acididurans]MBM9503952.1 hypothetical protein [Actinacidiphila acididurans]
MAGEEAAELQALGSFSALIGLHRDRTTLDIHPADGVPAVARLTKVGPLRKRAAYELFTGPGLKTPAGQLSASGILDSAGTPVGIVNLSNGKVPDADIHPLSGGLRDYVVDNPSHWRVVQPGLPALTGRAMDGPTKLFHNAVTDATDKIGIDIWAPDYFVTLTFKFSAPGCEGFTVVLTSRKSRLDVTVHDPRVDRRLILACLAALTLRVMRHPRRDILDGLPLWRPGRNRKS